MTDRRDLDAKMKELRAITARLEGGKLSLESAIAEHERGAAIGREIDAMLGIAEQTVHVVEADGRLTPLARSCDGEHATPPCGARCWRNATPRAMGDE